MTASIERFGPVDKSSDVAQALRRDGAAIVEGALPAEVMDLLAAKLRPHLDAQEIGGGSFFGHRRRQVAGIYAMGPEFAEHLMLHERVLEVTDEILRPEFPMAASASKQARSLGLEEEDLEAAAKRLFEPPDPVTGPFCHHYRVNVCSAMEVWGQGRNQPLHREMGNYLPYLQHDPDMPRVHRRGDLGRDGLPGRQRRHARGAGQPSLAQRPARGEARGRAGRDAEGLGALLDRQGPARARREPGRRAPHRDHQHLRRQLARPGREPVPDRAAPKWRAHCPSEPNHCSATAQARRLAGRPASTRRTCYARARVETRSPLHHVAHCIT